MARCPNCNYKLVLLSDRLKYKCSICSKLYPIKEVEAGEFRNWNKKQKELDVQNFDKELVFLKEQKTALRKLFRSSKRKQYGGDIVNEINRKYWSKNKDKINAKKREKYELKKEEILENRNRWRLENKHTVHIIRKLADLRAMQKYHAVQICKNKEYKLYTNEIQNLLPTFVHSVLLVM